MEMYVYMYALFCLAMQPTLPASKEWPCALAALPRSMFGGAYKSMYICKETEVDSRCIHTLALEPAPPWASTARALISGIHERVCVGSCKFYACWKRLILRSWTTVFCVFFVLEQEPILGYVCPLPVIL